jgi:hypothetical protein
MKDPPPGWKPGTTAWTTRGCQCPTSPTTDLLGTDSLTFGWPLYFVLFFPTTEGGAGSVVPYTTPHLSRNTRRARGSDSGEQECSLDLL